jgi:Flp pilus assembly pilin Flp
MTEYTLVLAAVAVAVYGAYRALGNNIGSLANGVDSTLTNA